MPLLKCVIPLEAKYIIRKIHKGMCENYTGGQSLAFRALRQGYYWLTIKVDCMEYAH